MSDYLTVWKFAMVGGVAEFDVPSGATLLAVETQDDLPCLWYLVDPTAAPVKHTFVAFGTGHAIPNDGRHHYVGTAHGIAGGLVFHIFERDA